MYFNSISILVPNAHPTVWFPDLGNLFGKAAPGSAKGNSLKKGAAVIFQLPTSQQLGGVCIGPVKEIRTGNQQHPPWSYSLEIAHHLSFDITDHLCMQQKPTLGQMKSYDLLE